MGATFPVNDGSRQHHYIPVYFIKGFTNEDGLLYVYDKIKDEFLKPKTPKQLFYENDGNTSHWGEVRNTLAELSYSVSDSRTAHKIHVLRKKQRESLTEEDTAFMFYHMALQYLRCPSNLGLYGHLYKTMKIWAPELFEKYPLLKNFPMDETLMKFTRSFLPGYIIHRLAYDIVGPYPFSIFEHNTEDFLVLTDNPVVYAPPPIRTEDLFSKNMIAISSRRLVINGELKALGSDILQLESYNVLAVAQAKRLICASNKIALSNAIAAWKWIVATGNINTENNRAEVRKALFASDAGGYWYNLVSSMRQVFVQLTASSGWNAMSTILQSSGMDHRRLTVALDMLYEKGLVRRKEEAQGLHYCVR